MIEAILQLSGIKWLVCVFRHNGTRRFYSTKEGTIYFMVCRCGCSTFICTGYPPALSGAVTNSVLTSRQVVIQRIKTRLSGYGRPL